MELSDPGLLFVGSFLITHFISVPVTGSVHVFCHSLLACRFSAKKSANNLMAIPLYVIWCFSLVAFNIFSLYLIFVKFDYYVPWCVPPWIYPIWDSELP